MTTEDPNMLHSLQQLLSPLSEERINKLNINLWVDVCGVLV